MTDRPLLTEETHEILHRILDKSDAGHTRLQLKFNSKETPELYRFDDQRQVNAVWNDLIELERHGIIIVKIPSQQRPGYEEYHGGKLILKLEAEETLRHWLNRPAIDPHYILWHSALNKYKDIFEDTGDALKKDIVLFPGRNYEQIARAFAKVNDILKQPQTLRQLSSQCFWGESKFLDTHAKEMLIVNSFPSLAHNILNRPLLLAVCIPDKFIKILFVENQDTFLELAKVQQTQLALIFLGGFRGTALRSREPGQTIFSYLGNTKEASKTDFEDFWLGSKQNDCFFWGDLDYAGLCILEALRKVFPTVEAWQPGYQPMLEKIQNGLGHSPGAQNKEKQFRPGIIGCDYSDHILLPAIEAYGAFLDQESIPVNTIDM